MSLKGRIVVSGRGLAMSLCGVFGRQGSSEDIPVSQETKDKKTLQTLPVYYSQAIGGDVQSTQCIDFSDVRERRYSEELSWGESLQKIHSKLEAGYETNHVRVYKAAKHSPTSDGWIRCAADLDREGPSVILVLENV